MPTPANWTGGYKTSPHSAPWRYITTVFQGKGGGQVCTGLYCSSPHVTVSNTLSLRRVQLLLPNKILMMKGNVYKKCIAMFDSILSHPFFDFEKKIFPFREKYQYSQLVQLCFCRKKTSFKKRLRTRQMGGGTPGTLCINLSL